MIGRYAIGRNAIGRTPEEGAYAINAEAGSFAWTGQAADLYSLILTAEAGSFTWAGQDVAFLVNYPMTADAGSFVWTGQSADLYSIILSADAGAFVWTGHDADYERRRQMLRMGASSTPFVSMGSSGGGRINIRAGRTC